jgi:hypothetical protein
MPWGLTVAYLRSIEGTLIGLSTPPKSGMVANENRGGAGEGAQKDLQK